MGYPELMGGGGGGGVVCGRGRATFIAISKDVKHAVCGAETLPHTGTSVSSSICTK